MAYKSVTATIRGDLLAGTLDPGLLFGTYAQKSITSLPSVRSGQMKFGTGAGNVNLLATVTGTLVASTVNIDLTAVLDPNGTSKNWARVKAIAIYNFSTTDGNKLLVGGAASNAWAAPFNGSATAILVVPAGWIDSGDGASAYPGVVLIAGANATALATSGTSKVLKLDSGAATIPYGVALVGCDA